MKKLQYLILVLAFSLMGYSSALHAEDTDIYVANAQNLGTPNVLFVIDTGANFSSSAAVPCTAYASGGTPSLGNTAGGIEQCALVDAISGLNDSAVNIGILVNNNNNFATDTRAATDPAYHETCQGTYGGCVVRKLAVMNAAGKASLVNFIKSWKTSGQDSATEFNVKSGGDRTANMMQEAWAYFNGKIGMSTKNYGTSILASGCQKNFIVFIGNSFNNSGGPADSGTESPYSGTYGMTATQTGSTTAQRAKISDTIVFTPKTCGADNAVANTSASNWSENWADEWARLMYQQNGGGTNQVGTQNIITYTIGVVNDSGCKPDYSALLTSMANYGGGQYFKAGTSADIKNALDTILNQVQAVNSVFSSASLPVSVNADGSYLNQIYLGMFRPDSLASPRWLGNLKQYHLIKNAAGTLVQGDANNVAAINPSTGFISPTAVSFWTKKDTTSLPDSAGGFWKKATASQGIAQSPYDSPDGEVVEKGGVSQQLRLEGLTADFTATAQTTSNPRRMYVYCPTGSSCVADLTNSANQFSTSNANISTSAFGADTVLPVTSIVRTGTTALVTTSGNHGFSSGTTVTISGATQTDYNVSQSVTVNSSTTFTITGLPDYPTSPSAGTYLVSPPGGAAVNITSMVRDTHTSGGYNSETVTVTTSAAHGFTTASNVTITGASPGNYNYSGLPATVPSSTTFTFNVALSPKATAANVYYAQLDSSSYPSQSVSLSNPTQGEIDGSTSTAHKLHVGQTVKITGSSNGSKYTGTYTITSVPSVTTFKITGLGNSVKNQGGETGSVAADTTTKQTISTLSRAASTDSATAVATGLPSNWFGASTGDTVVVNVGVVSGTNTNEDAYKKTPVTATCLNSGCTSLSYPITVTPTSSIQLLSASVGLTSATSTSLAAGQITRSGTTATVTGIPANRYTNGQTLTISATGTALDSESDYTGNWVIDCTADTTCSSFKFGPVNLTPATPATGVAITAFAAGTPPDRNTLIRWIRGQDNFGGEKGPGGTVTVRPSIHGDVLHSRPLVINYGDSRGIVVYYGANDGVFRAVNGNQTTGSIGGVPPGDELWGLVLTEHFDQYNRQRLASPALKFPTTTLSSARPKDYFVDGPTASYQRTKADGSIDKAYIFVTMRRGGRFMYALDVSDPLVPKVMWKIAETDPAFTELGQSWSRPRATLVQGGGLGTNPVLIFGAGYDPAEDSQPPAADTMGRGIYIVNAVTGALVWQANSTCSNSATCRNVPGMIYAVPSDIALVDRTGDGYTDKLYFGDMGGNIWRADIADPDSSNWTVTKLAALGCAEGTPSTTTHVCADGTAPRKFFFPPAVLLVKGEGEAGSFDAIGIPSGDREHPLKETATTSAYNANNKLFLINDLGTTRSTPVTHDLTLTDLFDATSTQYTGQKPGGFYINFATGEKGVNAPLATGGLIFFATNRPVDPSSTCAPNLGEAKAYAVSPFLGTTTTNLIVGGGLPPSPVAGLITVTTTNPDNTTTTSEEKFCIGCAAQCTSCSALENSPPPGLPGNALKRTYWYKK
jgi:Tfp pilus tip-associated adhesin PilY1